MRAVASGEVVVGTKRSLKAIRRGDAKLVIVAANCPRDVFSDASYYARLGGTPLHVFEKNSRELGLACGKPFTVNVVTILNPGESDILAAVGKR
jgi:large subunit ribosomal protein L30e